MDDDGSRQILCERCRRFVSISQIKYVSKGNDSRMALCTKCLTGFKPESSSTQTKSILKSSNMQSYYCSRCRYKFKFNADRNASLRCPYCGKSDRLEEQKATSAAAILKDSY